jgi:hypothetical protein
MSTTKAAGFKWPSIDGEELVTAINPLTGIPICRSCWDGMHGRGGCHIPGCQCGCYRGTAKGLGKVHKPANGCEEQGSFPDVGGFDLR